MTYLLRIEQLVIATFTSHNVISIARNYWVKTAFYP